MQRLSGITSSPNLGHSTNVNYRLDLNFWVEKEGMSGEKGLYGTLESQNYSILRMK
jgi:hypothetical protein